MMRSEKKIMRKFFWGMSCSAFAFIFMQGVMEVKAQTNSTNPLSMANEAKANFINTEGEPIGKARLVTSDNGVLIHLMLHDLPAGEHAIHIHEKGACTPVKNEGPSETVPSIFSDAGGHYNPHNKEHGLMNNAGSHAGDMVNIHVPEGGKLETQIFNSKISLGQADGLGNVFDADGSAIVIHEGADDYETGPSGDAGDRIACAVIEE